MQVLPRQQWQALRLAHRSRADDLSQAYRKRRARGQPHAVHDFLWTCYPLRPSRLVRWHPGVEVVLLDVDELPDGHRGVTTAGPDSTVDVEAFAARRSGMLEWTTAARPGRRPGLPCRTTRCHRRPTA